MTEFKDLFTLDGRLKAHPLVTRKKVEAVVGLIAETMAGSRSAKGVLEESLTTSDAIFNFAHATNMNVLANYPDVPRQWRDVVTGVRTVSDFRPVSLYSINPDWAETSASLGGAVIAPRVPEASTYPYATFVPEQSASGAGIVKRGFAVSFTLEQAINDITGFIEALPEAMRTVALDTEEYEVFAALLAALTVANDLTGGETPEGVTVPANAPLSRDAVIRAIIEISNREINGRKVVLSGGFKLLVPAGYGPFAEFMLKTPTLSAIDDGSYRFTVNGYDPLASVQIVESIHIASDNWVLMPNGNSANRPVIEALQLAGHQLPELHVRVDNAVSATGQIGAFDRFSFDNDSADLRIRQFFGAVVWEPQLIIWSNGTST